MHFYFKMLAKEIKENNSREFAIAGIISVTDKFIDKDYCKKIKEWIAMTQLARLYEEEKIDALNKANEDKILALNKITEDIAIKMLKKGIDLLEIMEITGLPKDRFLSLQSENRNKG